ncbi:hypothetical protein C7212DRAFT_21464, partial [Tuber magnatum]
MAGYYQPGSQYPYTEAPAPPPVGSDYSYLSSPDVQYADPNSPMILPVTPNISPVPSRDSSRNRRGTVGSADPYIFETERGRGKHYPAHLAIGHQGMARSNSERSRNRPPVYVEVAKSATRSGGSPSETSQYYYSKTYREGSTYSNSSYGGSQTHSRSHSKVRGRHSRSPSCDSCDSFEATGYEVGLHHGPDAHHHNKELATITRQLQDVELQLKQVKAESESKKQAEENARIEKLRTEEIERRVSEKLRLQHKQEREAQEKKKRHEEEERRKIEDAAKRLLEEKEKAARDRAAEERRRKEELEASIQARLMAMGQQQQPQQQPQQHPSTRRTYTKFSKIHLCKEALDERQISYTEEPESFLVHRAVDKQEQNYLWGRTREIRGYYRQVQEAADRAPAVLGPNGGYVKYVQIAGQP